MAIIGRGSKSLRKKDVQESKQIALGFKKLVFAHEASAGDTTINLGSLSAPSEMTGFTNPSSAELASANLFFFRKNLTLVSSLRGTLVDYLSYDVTNSTNITLKFDAEEGEIFVGTVDANPRTGLNLVAGSPIIATGTLTKGTTGFNVGTPFKTGEFPLQQIGEVVVYVDGVQQFRNTGNSSSTLDGNYYEVESGGGLGTIIRFNTADPTNDRSVMVHSIGVVAEKPDGSQKAEIENIAGQVDQMVPTLAALAGVPETVFQAAPNNVDLKQFGDRVLELEKLFNADVPIVTPWASYTPTFQGFGTPTGVQFLWRRNGESIEIQGRWITGTVTAVEAQVSLPNSYAVSSTYTSRQLVGLLESSNTAHDNFNVNIAPGDTFLNFGRDTVAAATANTIFNSSETEHIFCTVKIEGWDATQTLREQLGL